MRQIHRRLLTTPDTSRAHISHIRTCNILIIKCHVRITPGQKQHRLAPSGCGGFGSSGTAKPPTSNGPARKPTFCAFLGSSSITRESASLPRRDFSSLWYLADKFWPPLVGRFNRSIASLERARDVSMGDRPRSSGKLPDGTLLNMYYYYWQMCAAPNCPTRYHFLTMIMHSLWPGTECHLPAKLLSHNALGWGGNRQINVMLQCDVTGVTSCYILSHNTVRCTPTWTMPDSIATFFTSTKQSLRAFYHKRCVLCLCRLTVQGSQCAHILDPSNHGATQVSRERVLT